MLNCEQLGEVRGFGCFGKFISPGEVELPLNMQKE